jgi:hypothetical protein
MEVEYIEQRISTILKETYKVAEPSLVLRLKEAFDQSSSIQHIKSLFELQKKQQDFESRKLSLDAAVKTINQTGGDLTENAIKYKRFLLNETVNEA